MNDLKISLSLKIPILCGNFELTNFYNSKLGANTLFKSLGISGKSEAVPPKT